MNDYLNDIAKYAPTSDKPKARNCYLSIPRQLAKENTKFGYKLIGECTGLPIERIEQLAKEIKTENTHA